MKNLKYIHVLTGTAVHSYQDTKLTFHGEENGFSSNHSTTAAALGSAAFATLATWLLGVAAAEGWSLQSAMVELLGEVEYGEEVLDEQSQQPLPRPRRRAFAIALTLIKDGGERTNTLNSESIPEAARDALPALWDAIVAFFAASTAPN